MTTPLQVPPSPAAVRLRRPGWRDTRLLVGLVLVAVSVVVGASAISAAGRTVPVYVASEPLVPGEPVDAGALAVREVRLAESTARYLEADGDLPVGLVAIRTVGEGELVPAAAVASTGDLGLRPIAIAPDGALSADVVEGSTIDLWFVPAVSEAGVEEGANEPYELAGGLTVAEVTEPTGSFSVGAGATVHVLVPRADLSGVLAALADEGSVEIVPVPGAS
jgi:hypothetical protein